MTKRLLLASLLLSSVAAPAQVRVSAGPQLGYTLATTTYQLFAAAAYDTHYRSGFSGGLTGELGLGHFFARPAVLYTQKGYNQEEVRSGASLSTTSRVRTDYLTLPLQLGYSQRRDGQGLQVFAGPYAGLILGGHYTREAVYGATSSGGARQETYSGGVVAEGNGQGTADQPIRRWDAGLQAGIGYRHQQWLAQLDYSQGLLNADPNRAGVNSFYGSSAYHNRVFQVSLAYLFKLTPSGSAPD